MGAAHWRVLWKPPVRVGVLISHQVVEPRERPLEAQRDHPRLTVPVLGHVMLSNARSTSTAAGTTGVAERDLRLVSSNRASSLASPRVSHGTATNGVAVGARPIR